jgi:hypothetical protein
MTTHTEAPSDQLTPEQEKDKEVRRIRRMLKAGRRGEITFPERTFIKDAKTGKLERDSRGHLTWRTESTLLKLTKEA